LYIARQENGPVANYAFRSLTSLENGEQFGVSLNLRCGETCQAQFINHDFIVRPTWLVRSMLPFSENVQNFAVFNSLTAPGCSILPKVSDKRPSVLSWERDVTVL